MVLLLLLYTSLFNKSYHVFIFFVSIKSWWACFFNCDFWKLTTIKFKFIFCFTMRMSSCHVRRTWIDSFLFSATCHSSILTLTFLRASGGFDEIIFVSSLRCLLASIGLRTVLMMNTIINLILSRSLLGLTHNIYTLTWELDHVVQFYPSSGVRSCLFRGVKRRQVEQTSWVFSNLTRRIIGYSLLQGFVMTSCRIQILSYRYLLIFCFSFFFRFNLILIQSFIFLFLSVVLCFFFFLFHHFSFFFFGNFLLFSFFTFSSGSKFVPYIVGFLNKYFILLIFFFFVQTRKY